MITIELTQENSEAIAEFIKPYVETSILHFQAKTLQSPTFREFQEEHEFLLSTVKTFTNDNDRFETFLWWIENKYFTRRVRR